MLFIFAFYTEDQNLHIRGKEKVFSYLDKKASQLNYCELALMVKEQEHIEMNVLVECPSSLYDKS